MGSQRVRYDWALTHFHSVMVENVPVLHSKGNQWQSKKITYCEKWEKIFTNDITKKGLIFNYINSSDKLNINITNNPIKKWAKDLNKHFSKQDIQMAHRHTKRCSTLLIIREMQIKITTRYHLTPVRMASSKSTQKTNVGEDMEKKEPCALLVGMLIGAANYGKQYDILQKTKNRTTIQCNNSIPFTGSKTT